MKFGVLQFFSWPGRRVPLDVMYDRVFQRIDVMERTGYDAVWLAEHHFSTYSVCPSIHMMGTHIAARTERLRIGTAVSLAPFYHPLRLAEEVALLDVLSDGRVNWGVGRGFDPTEYRTFGVDPEQSYPRFREAVELVLAAWRSERLTFHGEFHTFEDIEVLPKPLQQPHPPVWLAATSPGAIDWCAEQGYSILMDPHASHGEIAEKRARYESGLETAGFSMAGRVIPMARNIAVGTTLSEAQQTARQGAQFMFGSYLPKGNHHAKASTGAKAGQQKTVDVAAVGDLEETDPVSRYVAESIIWGTPDKVIDDLQALEEKLPLEYLMCAPLSHASFELFTERVMPAFL
jgi:alkanesulfonate monooxygenase SsuD/methylene tetrahydromethanopterin reductase-like flavin-dependent oxidoreductase (luciferase family)